MRRHTLTTRLTLSHVLVTLAGLVLLGASLLFLVRYNLRTQTVAQLSTSARLSALYAAELAVDTPSLVSIAPMLGRRFTVAPDVTVRVLAPNGAVLYASSDLGPYPSNASLPFLANRMPIHPVVPESTRRFVAQPIVHDGRTIGVVELSRTLAHEREMLQQLLLALLPSILVALASAAIVGHLLARGLVSPLKKLRRVAAIIARGDLQARATDRSTDEIGQLASEINSMADDLQVRLVEVERLAHARQQFYRTMSHELRTPLTAILGTAENLQDDATPEQQEALNIILAETSRMQRLVNELLHTRDAETASLRRRHPVDLSELITEACHTMRERAERSGMTLTATTPSKLVVNGDRDRLKQALLNLLDNAVMWTPVGGTIEIIAEEQDVAVVRVCDTGTGIPPHQLEQVWKRGFSTSGGQGLGLPLVHDIVRAHGGTVRVLDGTGTTIELRLPLLQASTA